MLGSRLGDVASVLTWIIAVFLSILVHELGHALAMRAYGFRPWIVLLWNGRPDLLRPRLGPLERL